MRERRSLSVLKKKRGYTGMRVHSHTHAIQPHVCTSLWVSSTPHGASNFLFSCSSVVIVTVLFSSLLCKRTAAWKFKIFSLPREAETLTFLFRVQVFLPLHLQTSFPYCLEKRKKNVNSIDVIEINLEPTSRVSLNLSVGRVSFHSSHSFIEPDSILHRASFSLSNVGHCQQS